jgi:hypothetical protein
MTTRRSFVSKTVACVAASLAIVGSGGTIAKADPIFATGNPDGGFFGYIGFDVFTQQSVAARFVPSAAYTLDTVSIWFMSNDFDGTTPQTVTVSLRTDVNPGGDFVSAPSEVVLETWTMNVPVVGWNPLLVDFTSATHPALAAGQKYWVVAESAVEAQVNPIWVWSSEGNEFTATNQGAGTPWQSGSGAAIGIRVQGTAAAGGCRADFDHSGGLAVADIFEFLNAWFAGSPSANFDETPGLQVQDIFAFLNAWFAGC